MRALAFNVTHQITNNEREREREREREKEKSVKERR